MLYSVRVRETRAGRSILCNNCRSPIPVEVVSGTIHCPFCGSAQTLAPEIAEGLQHHERSVDQKMAAADEHYLHANAWQQWSRMDEGQGPGPRLLKFYLLVIGLPLVISMVAIFLHNQQLIKIEGPELSFGLMGVSMISVVLLIIKTSGAKRGTMRAQVGPTKVACPNCGARGALTEGQSVDSCQFCKAALVPTNTIMSMQLDAVKVELRRAAMARYREERLGMAKLMGFSAAGWVPYLAFGPVLAGWGLAMLFGSIEMVRGTEPFEPLILLGWAFYAACIGGFLIFRAWRASKKEAWHRAISDLTRQFHGQVYPKVLDWVRWLNTFWPASYKSTWVAQGRMACSVGLNVGGFATLVIADPTGHDQHRAAKIHILVAAWIPGVSEGTKKRASLNPQAKQAKQALLDAGFHVHISAAGVMAEASQQTIKWLRKHPTAAHVLASTATLVSEVAVGAGGTPSPAIP